MVARRASSHLQHLPGKRRLDCAPRLGGCMAAAQGAVARRHIPRLVSGRPVDRIQQLPARRVTP